MEKLLGAMSGGGAKDLMTYYEAEELVRSYKQVEIEDYGSFIWFKQNDFLQRLNAQAHANALLRADEFVMDAFVTEEKIKTLIYELLVCEAWKTNVLPLIKEDLAKSGSFRAYLAIYHETIVANLLEILFYHRQAVEAADNYLLDLIDYCYRKFLFVLNTKKERLQGKSKDIQEVLKRSRLEEFEEQIFEMDFSIAMMCLSIIRYLTDYTKYLPVSVLHHLLIETDIMCILIPLLEQRAWIRTNDKGEREKFENYRWATVPKSDYSTIPKLEAQIWISIYNLFMDPECRKKYEINEFRKNNLLRLRKYMNEVLLDQIPLLSTLLRTLEELSLMAVGSSLQNMNGFIIQQVPELRNKITENKDWVKLAVKHLGYFQSESSFSKEDFMRLAELYGSDIMQGLIDGFKCASCKQDASKRCKRCAQVWYCSRECQVKHWPDHKKVCQEHSEVKLIKQEAIKKEEPVPEAPKKEPVKAEPKKPMVTEVEAKPEPLKEAEPKKADVQPEVKKEEKREEAKPEAKRQEKKEEVPQKQPEVVHAGKDLDELE